MEPNAFIGLKKAPTKTEVAKALGKSQAAWTKLINQLKEIAPDQEWHSYSVKAGWSLKLKKKERVIVYFGPCAGSFRVAFALGDKAIQAAKASGLPKDTIKLIDEAKKYVEGTAVRFEPVTEKDIDVIKKLAIAKANN
jgi:hypothetical protein